MDKLKKLLREFGFNDKEVLVYAILLKGGPSPASTIAKLAELQRSTCYALLDQLVEKGLINQIIKNNIHFYYSMAPAALVSKLKQRQNGLLALVGKMESEVKNLKLDSNAETVKPKAMYYSKITGIKHILDDILSSNPQLIHGYISKSLDQLFSNELKDFIENRIEKQIFAKVINPFATKQKFQEVIDFNEKRERRHLPEIFDVGIDFMVYQNKIAVLSVDEEFGIVIESRTISSALRKLFDYVWRFALRH